jgi:hypothetical protein
VKTRGRFVLFFAVPLLLASGAHAQTEAWRNTAEVYFQGAGMSGTVGVGPLETHISATFSQILDNLQFGAMANYRGESPTFAVTADVAFFALGTTVTGPAVGFLTAKVDADQWLVTATAAYRASKTVDVFAGLRLTSLTDTLVLTPNVGAARTARLTETWVDPILGVRVKEPIGKGWSLEAYGDLGGFGVGSDFTWMLQGRVDWQISRTVGASLGYRALYQNYATGSGTGTFKWNVTTQGPLAAINVSF